MVSIELPPCFLGGSLSPLYFPAWPGRSRLISSGFLVPGFGLVGGGERSSYFFLGLTSLLPPFSRRVSSGFCRSLGGGKSSKSPSAILFTNLFKSEIIKLIGR